MIRKSKVFLVGRIVGREGGREGAYHDLNMCVLALGSPVIHSARYICQSHWISE